MRIGEAALMRELLKLALVLTALLITSTSADAARPATPAQGELVAGTATVVDGDTIMIGTTRIRLEGIDAPEGAQTCTSATGATYPCGLAATRALDSLVANIEVRCEHRGNDKYGRMLGVCFAGDRDINAEMVRSGHAWAFVRYSTAYAAVEAEAKAAARGIWQGAATPAWDFRAARWASAETAHPGACVIKGNVTRGGLIYHMPWSPWYEKIRMDDTRKRWFCTEAEAMAAGWRPAMVR
jgi:endonuclease YncB( thermonuclease family)